MGTMLKFKGFRMVLKFNPNIIALYHVLKAVTHNNNNE